MPQFVILAYDATDADALERRMANREAHMAAMHQARAEGKALCGAALLDGDGKMVGSNVVLNMETRAEVDAWLAAEPYFTGKVWENITVFDAKLAPPFQALLLKK